MNTPARLRELKNHALMAANRLNRLLNTKDPKAAKESAEARSRHTPESDPSKLYSEYSPSLGNNLACPECAVSARGVEILVLEAETDSEEIFKCPKCGFMTTFIKRE